MIRSLVFVFLCAVFVQVDGGMLVRRLAHYVGAVNDDDQPWQPVSVPDPRRPTLARLALDPPIETCPAPLQRGTYRCTPGLEWSLPVSYKGKNYSVPRTALMKLIHLHPGWVVR